MKGTYYGNDWYEEIPQGIFYKNYQKVIDHILAMPEVITKVACLPDVEDVVLGYSVYANDTLHFMFVKESWRKMGIANSLCPKDIKTCTHLTRVGKYLKRKYQIVFNPFI